MSTFDPTTSRRVFLKHTTTGLAAAALLRATPSRGEHPPPPVRPAERVRPHSGFEPVPIPDWVHGVTRMAFVTPDQVEHAARCDVQVAHGNAVWPYFPLRRDGGGLPPAEKQRLDRFVRDCHAHQIRLVLGLPPFPPVALVRGHPDWRVHADEASSILKTEPEEGKLGSRVGCNLGPWGDYLIEVCVELFQDFGVDGYSFDGNYHPPICYCPTCKMAYAGDTGRAIPPRVDLDDIAYRAYLIWRGERLEQHYRRLQNRLKGVRADAVVMSWTVNAGRYGHLLQTPRSMPTRLNRLFDLPMQEWWLDETNLGASVAPAFGAAYLAGTTGGRPNASEPYLMSRGNPYGTDSFPRHERLTRALLAMTNGSLAPQSFGWPGHAESTCDAFREIRARERWITGAQRMPWAGLLVSEQTRQFYAYRDIAGGYLPHVFGAFRCAAEEHLALSLVNDWDLRADELARYRVLVLAHAAALSDAQAQAVRDYVAAGGGLVATAESSLADELGRPRDDFALADLFGVSYRGRPKAAATDSVSRPALTLDERYWSERSGVATLTWSDHELLRDPALDRLVPTRSVRFRGPLLAVSEPANRDQVAIRLVAEHAEQTTFPAAVVRPFGKGRVVFLAAGIDAALWSYAYPYQRRLFARALEWAAGGHLPIAVTAPMCVQATFFVQNDAAGRRIVLHLFNGVNTTAEHGLPGSDVPLREEVVPVHGIRVRFEQEAPGRFHVEPGGLAPVVHRDGDARVVEMPPLEIHAMLVGEA